MANSKEVHIKSVKRKTLSKQVIDQIIELLMSGQFKPGDKLPTEMELMEKLFVSRPVLREALSSLETMGIIHRRTREGTFFSEKIGSRPFSMMLALSAGDQSSVMEARMSLEIGLVTLAAEKITDEQLKELKGNIEVMKNQTEDYSTTDKEFHRIIALSASNAILEGIVDPLLNMFDHTDRLIPNNKREHAVTLGHHVAIYEALKARDSQKAILNMLQHLDHVRKKINY